MRIGFFGEIAPFQEAGVNTEFWTLINAGEPLVGDFAKVVFVDLNGDFPSDSWFAAAEFFLTRHIPIFWCVKEHENWRRKIEKILLDQGARVLDPGSDLNEIIDAIKDFSAIAGDDFVSSVYSIRFDSFEYPEDSAIIDFLSELDSPEEWIRGLVREHVLKKIRG